MSSGRRQAKTNKQTNPTVPHQIHRTLISHMQSSLLTCKTWLVQEEMLPIARTSTIPGQNQVKFREALY